MDDIAGMRVFARVVEGARGLGRKARRRGGKAKKRGLSREQAGSFSAADGGTGSGRSACGRATAGGEIGMSPSAVSRRIGELENGLGARLFQRTTRKLSLIEAGSVYDQCVRAILADVDAAKRAVAELGGAPTGVSARGFRCRRASRGVTSPRRSPTSTSDSRRSRSCCR